MSDMRHGWLSPGTTDTDIDREAQGEYKPPFYCSVYERISNPAPVASSHAGLPDALSGSPGEDSK